MPATYEAHLAESLLQGEKGLGHVIVVRKKSPERVDAGIFLVDAYCLGVRDAFLFEGTEAEFRERFIEQQEEGENSFREMPAAYGRKFVEEAVAYARRLGFAPHRSYKKAARVFGGLKAAPDLGRFSFGSEGKPLYVQSQYHSADDARRIIGKLHRVCGEGNYHYIVAADDHDADDEDDAEGSEEEPEERLLLSEGWLDYSATAPGDQPSRAARRAFEEFAAKTDSIDDELLDHCYWESRSGESTLGQLIEMVRGAKVLFDNLDYGDGDWVGFRGFLLSIMVTLLHLVRMTERERSHALDRMLSNSGLKPELIRILRELAEDEKMVAALESIVHPDEGVTLLPVTLEKIDAATGHYLLVAVEQRF